MHLYQLTLQRSSAVTCAVAGNFSAPGEQEIVVSHGKAIELLRADAGGKLLSACYMECFGLVRSLAAVRLPGTNVDCLAMGSDSGRLALVHYIPERDQFERIHLDSYGKSGCRRTVAGQYMAVDPAGRALMLAAIEKQRVVYTFDRDANSLVSMSAPIEAPRPGAITFSIAALDVLKGNPVFACIELEYGAPIEGDGGEAHKILGFYEVDISCKPASVVKRNSEPLDPASNMLIPVPGGAEGPGGVLVCAENKLAYFRETGAGDEVVALIPRRAGMPIEQPLLITAHTVLRKSGKPASLLLQSEVGDVYVVAFSSGSSNVVSAISVEYYDTLPVAISLLALGPSPGGRLFVAGEFSDHRLYQFLPPQAGIAADALDMVQCEAEGESFHLPHFAPRGLRHLVQLDAIESLSPVLDLQCADLAGEDAMQLYALCGRGPRSSLRALRHGLSVAEMAVSEMPVHAYAVWTVKASAKEAYHSYIIVGLANEQNPTIVLSVGDSVELCTSVKFQTQRKTITVAELGPDMIVQVHQMGIHILKAGREVAHALSSVSSGGVLTKNIKAAAVSGSQMALILVDNSLLHLELNAKGDLVPARSPEAASKAECVAFSPVVNGGQRARFMAVGASLDGAWTLVVFRLDGQGAGGGASGPLKIESRMLLNGKPQSLCVSHAKDGPWGTGERGDEDPLVCYVGLENEMLIRVHMDGNSGELSKDFRCRSLGGRSRDDAAQPIKLIKVAAQGLPAVMALCSRPWLSYSHQGSSRLTPIAYDSMESAAAFSSPQCPEGIVCVMGRTLRILSVHHYGEVFQQQTVRLAYTPRKSVLLHQAGAIVVIETDHNANKAKVKDFKMIDVPGPDPDEVDVEGEGHHPYQSFGVHRAGEGRWASCIRVVDPSERERSATKQVIDMAEDEAAVSICVCTFADKANETFVLVGSVLGLRSASRAPQGQVHVYTVSDTAHLSLVHKTLVDGVPRAMCAFQGRVLIGCDKALRIYDLGKKKLLHKCATKKFSTWIQSVSVLGERIFVADATDSVALVRYNSLTNTLETLASDTRPRWVTAASDIDYDTVAGGDKFGNLFVCRLDSEAEACDAEEDRVTAQLQDAGTPLGSYDTPAPKLPDAELCEIAHFHVGETITCVRKAKLVEGGTDAILYSTISGGIGAVQPIVKGRDSNLFMHLEMHLRGAAGAREPSDRYDHPSLCGTDQLAFRSYYLPVKDVIDGDLCETYFALDPARQKQIADELDRTPGEIAKKLEDMRSRLL